jgi:hypothetical protein
MKTKNRYHIYHFLFTIAILFIIAIFLTTGCHSPTGPGQNNQLDTTSHAFTWKTYVLGDGNASTLNGVAIINDTLVYVVGDIEKMDSTGQFDPDPYNLAVWDGYQWLLQRIQFYTICGQSHMTSYPINSIFEFNQNDIWFSDGDEMVHWTGTNYEHDCSISSQINGAINKIWGTSSNNLYVVGNVGTILHFSSNSWQKLSSGTTTDINDVWGINSLIGQTVYCPTSNSFDPNEDKKILKVTNGNKVDSIKWIGREVYSVWTPDGNHLYTAGDGVFENDGSGWKEMVTGASIATTRVRGNSNADWIVVGGFGFIAHWNGKDFKIYPPAGDIIYRGLAMKGNTVVAVGTTGEDAVVTIGKRKH